MNRISSLGSIALGLLLISEISLPVKAQIESEASSPGYTFKCIPQTQKEVFATVTVRPDSEIIDPPLIIWESQYFNAKGYTPKRRCEVVTDKLNTVIAAIGGNPANLRLTMGKINNLRVICYVNNTKLGCDSNNILITLSERNRTDSSLVMAGMIKFSVTGAGTALTD